VPAGRRVAGRLAPPPSKSHTHRYFNLALVGRRPLVVERPLDAEDTRLFVEVLRRLGRRVETGGERVEVGPPPDPEAATAAGSPAGPVELECGNAGTLYRFLVAALTTMPGSFRLDGVPRLRERPVGPLIDALRALGARIDCPRQEGYAPLVVHGGTLAGGRVRLDAGESSQFLSALLMASLAARRPVEVEVAALTSGPYVELTLGAVGALGGAIEQPAPGVYRVRPGPLDGASRVRVEGDFSAACYPAAAAALTGGEVVLDGLERGSRQGDRGFFDLLAAMGAAVEWEHSGAVRVAGRADRGLAAVDADLGSMPDQVPTLAALAPFARGVTRITGVPHLRIKESDRLAAMASELGRLGAAVEELADGLVVPGRWAEGEPPADPVTVDPHGDHRIAMSLALAGLRRPGVAIARPGVVAKSYPEFWRDLDALVAGS
jgi:3-phosphoshikimate 1-carboxyvinyltransferase